MIGEEVIAYYGDAGDGEELFEISKLVRCKYCKWHTSYDECTHPYWDCEERTDYPTAMGFDYCSHGERIDNE